MLAPSPHEVTGLLRAWSAGDEEALQKLMPLVYQELHRAARHYMAGERITDQISVNEQHGIRQSRRNTAVL